MRIETKFAIGDQVWSVLNGRAHGFEINEVRIVRTQKGHSEVIYSDGLYNNYPEYRCFLSKEELVDWFMRGE